MSSVEIVDVAMSAREHKQLRGGRIDGPKPGNLIDGHEINVRGWVLGRNSPAVAMESVNDGNVIRRVPLDVRRPDIAAWRPQVPGANQNGSRTTVSVLGMNELELEVRAVLKDQSRVPPGITIRERRRWCEGLGGEVELNRMPK
jgi:hypothetical protein